MKISFDLRMSGQKTYAQKINKHIEIVGSSNPRINAMEVDAQLAILATLRKHYTKVAITIVNDMAGLKRLVAKKPDLVVLGMKFILLDPSKGYDESPRMWLSSYLKQHGIDCTGSHTEALTLEHNKHDAKQAVIDAGLQSTAYFVVKVNCPVPTHTLQFPLFVKPANSGDSMGIDEKSVVYTESELQAKVASIHKEHVLNALVEEYLPGREFSVAVTNRPGSDELQAMPVEIVAPVDTRGNNILSGTIKKADSEKVLAVTDPKLKSAINALAVGAFKALGARDYGRIDVRLDAHGTPNFIEANLMPGLSEHGYLARCFYLNNRISYEDMIVSVIDLCLQRMTLHMPKEAADQPHTAIQSQPVLPVDPAIAVV